MVLRNTPLDPAKTGPDAMSLEGNLRRLIVGQDEAIQEIVGIYQMHLTGMSAPGRPIGNFLFLGPTGSGKTRIVEATAETLLKNPRAVIKIDCAEFQHKLEEGGKVSPKRCRLFFEPPQLAAPVKRAKLAGYVVKSPPKKKVRLPGLSRCPRDQSLLG